MTSRGRAVLALGPLVYVVAWAFGSRALYPVSVGLIVAVALGVGWVRLSARRPNVRRRGPAHDVFEGDDVHFSQIGYTIGVIQPGRPSGMYHREGNQEDFLVLRGECLLIVEGEERQLRAGDFVHCPPGADHIFVGAGDGPCVILAASSRQFQKDGPWGFYCADETARRYNASSPEDTQDGEVAYGRFPPSQPARYRDGLL